MKGGEMAGAAFMSTPRIELRPVRRGKLVSGPAIATSGEEHEKLVDADKRFQAALDHAIATGSERIEAVEATVQLRRHTGLSL
jgi:DNA replication initiation complex subunit (GINS family)